MTAIIPSDPRTLAHWHCLKSDDYWETEVCVFTYLEMPCLAETTFMKAVKNLAPLWKLLHNDLLKIDGQYHLFYMEAHVCLTRGKIQIWDIKGSDETDIPSHNHENLNW